MRENVEIGMMEIADIDSDLEQLKIQI